MPIPDLDATTGYLPPSEHFASLDEVLEVFGTGGFRRKELAPELRWIWDQLRDRGVTQMWVDGSFVTAKKRPGDIEVVYLVPENADPTNWGELAPAERETLKRRHGIDLWPHPSPQPRTNKRGLHTQAFGGHPIPITEYFSTDREGIPKGIVVVRSQG